MAFRPKGGLSVMPLRVGASEAAAAGVSGGFKPTPRDIGDRLADVASGNVSAVSALEAALRQAGARRITVDVGVVGDQPYASITTVGKGTGPVTYHSPVAGNPEQVRQALLDLQRSYTR